MSLGSGASVKSLLHDLVESLQHKLDKLALGQRKLYDFLLVPKDRTFDFANRYPVLEDSGIYLLAPPIAPAKYDGPPEDWDKDGTLASFSAGSEIAALRQFQLTAKDRKGGDRKRRGKPRKADGKKEPLPPPPPDTLSRKFEPVPLEEVESNDYLATMLQERTQSADYHRWTLGAGNRPYWKGCPVTTRTVEDDDVGVDEFLGPLAQALQFAKDGDEAGLRKLIETQQSETTAADKAAGAAKKVVKGTSDLRRYTVNVAPALARAMSLLLEQGVENEQVRDLMVSAAPLVAAEFERVTGRKVIGVSVHFDSNLPHWNLWHSGLEPVIYKVGNSERTRFRRTAMDLNASGNMLAWDRVSRAFARAGEDFNAISVATASELKKAEARAHERQGRAPGDFTLNRKADEVLETALKELGYSEQIDRGYREFVANERKRYTAAIAGRDGKDLKKIIDLLPKQPGESPLDATRRLVGDTKEAKAILSATENENIVAAARRVADQATKSVVEREVIKEVKVIPPDLLQQHASALQAQKLVTQAFADELEAQRKKAANAPTDISKEVKEVARVLLDRMAKSDRKQEWEIKGSVATRAGAFLDWLEEEPVRLMTKFRKLVNPVVSTIKNWPPAAPLLKFLGIGKSK